MAKTFGQFVREKRIERGLSLRSLSTKTEISPVYMSNIENDRRPAPSNDYLDRIISVLRLDKEDAEILYDLAAQSKEDTVSGDLPDYIMRRDVVRVALRTAKDVDATDEEWLEFIEKLRQRDISREEQEDA
jgi:transcriptional regulator with XRE-family HTH domain